MVDLNYSVYFHSLMQYLSSAKISLAIDEIMPQVLHSDIFAFKISCAFLKGIIECTNIDFAAKLSKLKSI